MAETVHEILVESHIGDNGILADTITYKADNLPCLSKADFRIAIGEKHYDVISLSYSANTVTLKTEPFHFEGTNEFLDGKVKHNDFEVTCANDAFSFHKDDCRLRIKTVDDYINGTYKASNGIELPYWLYMPADANPVPLMVWEHGGGEVLATSYKGANLTKNRGATCWIESGKKTAVLSIQYPQNYSFGISAKAEELAKMEEYNTVKYELIQDLISSKKVDPKRVYVSGASSGGGAVLRFIMQYPDLFAAGLPICAKDTLIPISEPYGLAFKMQGSLEISDEDYKKCYSGISVLMQQFKIGHVPIWFIQAENDPVCTSYTSKILFDVLKKTGASENKITMYTNQEMQDANAPFYHASWIPAFNDTAVIEWIYDQHK